MSMNDQTVVAAQQEAERFIRLVAAYRACSKHSSYDACPDRAAARRASLDLTRALAKMRQS